MLKIALPAGGMLTPEIPGAVGNVVGERNAVFFGQVGEADRTFFDCLLCFVLAAMSIARTAIVFQKDFVSFSPGLSVCPFGSFHGFLQSLFLPQPALAFELQFALLVFCNKELATVPLAVDNREALVIITSVLLGLLYSPAARKGRRLASDEQGYLHVR